jgi:hypothetical protein
MQLSQPLIFSGSEFLRKLSFEGIWKPMTRQYEVYEPSVEHYDIYREEQYPEYRWSHMIAIEHFDGRFHAVWNNGHAPKSFKLPYQRLLWATSDDGKSWGPPLRITEEETSTPLDTWDEAHNHWQPSLLNYRDESLWCIWSITGGNAQTDHRWLARI